VPLVRSKDTKGKSVNRVTATFDGILRFGRKTDLVDRRGGVWLDFRINKHLSLLTSVLYRKDEVVKNVPHIETRLDFGATLSKTFHEFSFRDRNIYEHRFRVGRVNTDVYRHRIQVSHPLKHNNKTLFSPFVTDEAYFDIGSRSWTNNEFFAGVSRAINHRTAIEIAYIRADSKTVDVNGLSINLRITLR